MTRQIDIIKVDVRRRLSGDVVVAGAGVEIKDRDTEPSTRVNTTRISITIMPRRFNNTPAAIIGIIRGSKVVAALLVDRRYVKETIANMMITNVTLAPIRLPRLICTITPK